MLVLLANEPRAYREAFAGGFAALRPHVEAIVVEPDVLDREALRLRPELVVCDRITPTVEAVARSWIELRVEGERLVATSNVGALPAHTELRLGDLLSIVDQTEELLHRESSAKVSQRGLSASGRSEK